MHADVKRAWLVALRSGEYTQGKGQLRRGSEFCCLGVLCDLHARAGFGNWAGEGYGTRYDGDQDGLPATVRAWAGIAERYPVVNDQDITILNDGDDGFAIKAHSFADMADLIERDL